METETGLPTCYRHPDRETRLSCSNCARPVCLDCLQHADVGQRCPECAQVQPQAAAVATPARQVDARTTPVTFLLLLITVLVFAVTRFADEGGQLYRLLAQVNGQIFAADEWWRVLSAALLHDLSSLYPLHLLFNMFALYQFGPGLERFGGPPAYLLLYLASAAAGGLLFFLIGSPDGVAVGASGAIFGLFGAWLAASFHARHTTLGRQQLQQMLTLLAINMALPLIIPRIAWEAHFGGLAAGALIGSVWFGASGSRGAGTRIAAGLVVLVLAVAAVLLVRPLQLFG